MIRRLRMGLRAALIFATLVTAGVATAATTAGTPITNQSSATYSDSSGTTYTTTSNAVQTTVQQVGSVSMTSAQSHVAAAGAVVNYAHVITNSGNGNDSFALTTSQSGAFTLGSVAVYADNGSGAPTGSPITSTGVLAAGASFRVVVQATVSAGANSGDSNALVVTATSGFDTSKTASNTDTTTVSSNAVIALTSSISSPSGVPGSGPFTYTISYSNTGNSAATNVHFADALPAGFVYVAGSGLWSGTGAAALTDASGDNQGSAPNTIDYSVTGATINATLAQVPAGQSGTISFQVTVAPSAAAGPVYNQSNVQYSDGGGHTPSTTANVPAFTVTQVATVTVTPPAAVATAPAGSTVVFSNVVTNTGNGTDTFNMTTASSSFPAGTTFLLVKADGASPLTDSNGDGIVDTGPLAAGATTTVIVRATLPASATGGPFNVTLVATSTFDATKSGSGVDTLTAVGSATVDLTNNAAGGPGAGPGPEASPVLTTVDAPGTTATFQLVVANSGGNTETYDLAFGVDAALASSALPAGWTISFRADLSSNCSSLGAAITNTGVVAPAASARVCAVVTTSATGAGAAPGNTEIYFRAKSSSSGSADTLHDRLTISSSRTLAITPNHAGTSGAGGVVTYSHQLTNSGNVVEGNGSGSTIAVTVADSRAGYSSVAYYDANGNGVVDAGDPVIPAGGIHTIPALSAGLAPGQTITILVKTSTPPGANVGEVDNATVTVTTTNGSNAGSVPVVVTVTDATTIVVGPMRLVLEQALDSACNGTIGSYTQANLSAGAVPGSCIRYRMTATNTGAQPSLNFVSTTPTPAYTVYDTASGAAPASVSQGSVTAPANGAGGSVVATLGTIAPSASATLTFGVRILP